MGRPKIVIVPLMEGFEEIEAVTIIDVLRRADLDVRVAGDQVGAVRGAHGISVVVDCELADVDPATVSMVVLPGGMPGASHLRENPDVQALLQVVDGADGYVAAICAAPIALAAAGVITGKRVTCYPGYESELEGAHFVEDRVAIDEHLVTSRGPGTAMEFALELVALLEDEKRADVLREQMLVHTA